jgi:Lysophospholipase L1 and related esterases
VQATIFGDSILKAVLYENGKYRMNMEPEREFSAESGIQIHNYARFGCTIRKAIRWIRRDCEESGKPEDSVVLEFGGNDCDYDWARISQNPVLRIQCKTPPEEFAALYREALALIRQSGRRPVAMTLPPIHSLRYLNFVCKNGLLKENLLRWLGDAGAIGRRQRLYSELALQVAREEQAEVIDLRAAFPQDETALAELLCEDGIHPNQKGQARILNEIRTACCRNNYQTAHRSL